jgi:two-component system chemotaxis sensor kinase CheA
MSDEEVQHYIFEPGFSTAEKVTSTSGRGVGMDVVRSNIESIGGSVSIKSLPGRGSRFSLKIPLTLAIAPALIIKVADQRYALPQHAVVEAVGLGKNSSELIDKVQNALVLKLRDEVIPVVDLRSVLGLDDTADSVREGRLVVIMRVGPNAFGVIVDEVSDIQEIVVKPLSASIAHLKVFSGHTILGDGSVVLILDPGGIAVNLGIEKSAEKKHETAKEGGYAPPEKTRLILFRAGPGPQKVLPLSLISRIEMVEPNRIEQLDGRYMILHQGRLMPVIPVSMTTDVTAKAHPVLVTTVDQGAVGLLVEEIVDVIEEKLDVQLESSGAELVGSAELKGEGVELLDISYFLQAAYPASSQRPGAKGNRLLLVDDESFFRDMLTPPLIAAGYSVTAAKSGEEALEIFNQGAEFCAVIADTDMPGMSGYQLAKRLREGGLTAEFPIIGLIAHPSPSSMQSAQEHGMTMGIGKLDRLSLLSALNSILEPASHDQPLSAELAA